MSNRENKNCSELLLTNGMGLDGAPVKFLTFQISPLKVRPPSGAGTGKNSRIQDLDFPAHFAPNYA